MTTEHQRRVSALSAGRARFVGAVMAAVVLAGACSNSSGLSSDSSLVPEETPTLDEGLVEAPKQGAALVVEGDETAAVEPPDNGSTVESGGPCSGEGLTNSVEQGQPYSELATAIVDAAIACDYPRLAELAGPEISYSLDGGPDFAGFLFEREAAGDPALKLLVTLLNSGALATPDGTHVWPAAYGKDWSQVNEGDVAFIIELEGDDSLVPLYAEIGAYIGWRVGISADGADWLYFIAGD